MNNRSITGRLVWGVCLAGATAGGEELPIRPPELVTAETRVDRQRLAELQQPGEVFFQDDFETEASCENYFRLVRRRRVVHRIHRSGARWCRKRASHWRLTPNWVAIGWRNIAPGWKRACPLPLAQGADALRIDLPVGRAVCDTTGISYLLKTMTRLTTGFQAEHASNAIMLQWRLDCWFRAFLVEMELLVPQNRIDRPPRPEVA